MEAIFERRSIRKYEDRPVEKEKLEKLLRAAMQAPSAINEQPWEFMIIQNKDTLKRLSQMSLYSEPVAHAPAAILAMANSDNYKVPSAWQQDMGAAVENILLEAADLGLGAVWMGVATDEDNMNYIKDNFYLPDNIKPYALIPVGYPAQGEKNTFVDRYDPAKVHYEAWQ